MKKLTLYHYIVDIQYDIKQIYDELHKIIEKMDTVHIDMVLREPPKPKLTKERKKIITKINKLNQ